MILSEFEMRISAFLACAVLLCSVSSCVSSGDAVIASLGEYEKKEYFSSGEFQDFTDYAKYYFVSADIGENKYLNKIKGDDLITINTYLDDFESWIGSIEASNEIVLNYDFNRAVLDTDDYIYIDSEEEVQSDGSILLINYNIYLFDVQTQILYYFHNNI